MKLNIKILLILSAIFISGCFVFKYIYLSKVKIFQPINVFIKGMTHSDINTIKVECATPTDKKYSLPFDETKNSWQSCYSYNKSLGIIINDTVFSKVTRITIQIGKTIYKYDNNSFKTNWKSKNENGTLYFESPDNVRGSKSILLMILSVFLWGGIFRKILYTVVILISCYLFFKIFNKIIIRIIKSIFQIKIKGNQIQNYYFFRSYKISKVFVTSFLFSFLSFTIFLFFRGFGWDEDSVNSAVQFIKLINFNLYGIDTGSTVPKILTMTLLGLNYIIFGNFYLSTFISIILNSVMSGVLCKWIFEEKGNWLIFLAGFCLNYLVNSMIIDCDNPSFSNPFIFIGLYYYFHKKKIIKGGFLIFISSLFRPGSEFILLYIIAYEIFLSDNSFVKRNFSNDKKSIKLNSVILFFAKEKKTLLLMFFTAISLIHTFWGYLLAYPNYKEFYSQCIYFTNNSCSYKYSISAFYVFFKILITVIFNNQKTILIFTLLAIAGITFIVKRKIDIRFCLLATLQILIGLFSVFFYGNEILLFQPQQFAICTIIVTITAAFCNAKFYTNNAFFNKVILVSSIIIVLYFNAFWGIISKDSWQTDLKGNGQCKYYNCKIVKQIIDKQLKNKNNYSALITSDDRFTFVLDCGLNAKKINVIGSARKYKSITIEDVSAYKYDVILLQKSTSKDIINNIESKGYKYFNADKAHELFIKINNR